MKLAKAVLLLLLCLVALGFYRGWFSVAGHAGPQDNSVAVNMTVDGNKMKNDAEKMKNKTSELATEAVAEARDLGARANRP